MIIVITFIYVTFFFFTSESKLLHLKKIKSQTCNSNCIDIKL